MHQIVQNLIKIKEKINLSDSKNNKIPKIIAVSKTFGMDKISPLIEYGHTDFGENKVQEAVEKWSKVKEKNKNLKLHFVGNLQTNKVKFVIPLFDYIHSLDNLKLAEKISKQQIKINIKPKIFVQVNIGNEPHKNGISVNELDKFINICLND